MVNLGGVKMGVRIGLGRVVSVLGSLSGPCDEVDIVRTRNLRAFVWSRVKSLSAPAGAWGEATEAGPGQTM